MIEIPLQQIPNQKFTMQLDDSLYEITIKLTVNVMSVSIVRQNEQIVSNTRAEALAPIIPYLYLEHGNFIFFTIDDEYPNYELFGVTQFLFYFSAEELEVIRESN